MLALHDRPRAYGDTSIHWALSDLDGRDHARPTILVDLTTTPIDVTGTRRTVHKTTTASAIPPRGPITGPPDDVFTDNLRGEHLS
jgi:hypothetical protein